MNFMGAVEAMNKGKKVKLPAWSGYIRVSELEDVRWEKGGDLILTKSMMNAVDWEIYEEPKETLYMKSYVTGDEPEQLIEEPKGDLYLGSDVKEALQKFIEQINDHYTSPNQKEVIEEAKLIFGEELLGGAK